MRGAARFGDRRIHIHIDSKTFRWKGRLSAWGSARRKDGRLGIGEQDGSDSVESREDGPEGRQGQGRRRAEAQTSAFEPGEGRSRTEKGPRGSGMGAGERQ